MRLRLARAYIDGPEALEGDLCLDLVGLHHRGCDSNHIKISENSLTVSLDDSRGGQSLYLTASKNQSMISHLTKQCNFIGTDHWTQASDTSFTSVDEVSAALTDQISLSPVRDHMKRKDYFDLWITGIQVKVEFYERINHLATTKNVQK